MQVYQRLMGRLCLPGCVLTIAVLLGNATATEPDRLVRAYLGVSSIPARYPPPEGKKCCYLAVAKFDDGKFVGYVSLHVASVEYFQVSADRPNHEAEFGWAEKGGKFGYFVTTRGGSAGFQPDEFFRGLFGTVPLASGKAPTQTLGPFSVLGYAFGGNGALPEGAEPGDVRATIRGKFRVAVFLMAPFDTLEQAQGFGKALPKLSAD